MVLSINNGIRSAAFWLAGYCHSRLIIREWLNGAVAIGLRSSLICYPASTAALIDDLAANVGWLRRS